MQNETRVTFRAERSGDYKNHVTAVLPDEPANYGHCLCYAHVGQHSECARDWYVRTRRATIAESAALAAELRGIYGALRVVDRIPSAAWCRRT